MHIIARPTVFGSYYASLNVSFPVDSAGSGANSTKENFVKTGMK